MPLLEALKNALFKVLSFLFESKRLSLGEWILVGLLSLVHAYFFAQYFHGSLALVCEHVEFHRDAMAVAYLSQHPFSIYPGPEVSVATPLHMSTFTHYLHVPVVWALGMIQSPVFTMLYWVSAGLVACYFMDFGCIPVFFRFVLALLYQTIILSHAGPGIFPYFHNGFSFAFSFLTAGAVGFMLAQRHPVTYLTAVFFLAGLAQTHLMNQAAVLYFLPLWYFSRLGLRWYYTGAVFLFLLHLPMVSSLMASLLKFQALLAKHKGPLSDLLAFDQNSGTWEVEAIVRTIVLPVAGMACLGLAGLLASRLQNRWGKEGAQAVATFWVVLHLLPLPFVMLSSTANFDRYLAQGSFLKVLPMVMALSLLWNALGERFEVFQKKRCIVLLLAAVGLSYSLQTFMENLIEPRARLGVYKPVQAPPMEDSLVLSRSWMPDEEGLYTLGGYILPCADSYQILPYLIGITASNEPSGAPKQTSEEEPFFMWMPPSIATPVVRALDLELPANLHRGGRLTFRNLVRQDPFEIAWSLFAPHKRLFPQVMPLSYLWETLVAFPDAFKQSFVALKVRQTPKQDRKTYPVNFHDSPERLRFRLIQDGFWGQDRFQDIGFPLPQDSYLFSVRVAPSPGPVMLLAVMEPGMEPRAFLDATEVRAVLQKSGNLPNAALSGEVARHGYASEPGDGVFSLSTFLLPPLQKETEVFLFAEFPDELFNAGVFSISAFTVGTARIQGI